MSKADVKFPSSGGGTPYALDVEDEGSAIVSNPGAINFTGAGVTVTENPSGTAEVDIPGGGTPYALDIEDEGGGVVTNPTAINFTGNGYSLQQSPSGVAKIDLFGGIYGDNYIFVNANGTDGQNATELQAAYNLAKTMSPSATNRMTIIAANGYYDFGGSAFTMDTQYIDLVSLDGNRSIIFNSSNANGTISITANDVFVKGVDVQSKEFQIGNNLNLLKVENCKGGDLSFGYGQIVSGTFTNCIGGNYSFGNDGTASGTFINCIGGDSSFGGSIFNATTASGTFTNCIGGDYSFAGTDASFTFFVGGTASGTFKYCTASSYSFGGSNDTSGLSPGTASGSFTNCVGGVYSFGNDPVGLSTLSGKLYWCKLTSGNFQTVSGSGQTRMCLTGTNVEDNQG